MSHEHPHELVLTPPAVRAVQRGLPKWRGHHCDRVLDGLADHRPTRVGKSLRADLTWIYSARRVDYRVLYRVYQSRREVIVLRIDHRRDVYRT